LRLQKHRFGAFVTYRHCAVPPPRVFRAAWTAAGCPRTLVRPAMTSGIET
jgi:hypothetical protein